MRCFRNPHRSSIAERNNAQNTKFGLWGSAAFLLITYTYVLSLLLSGCSDQAGQSAPSDPTVLAPQDKPWKLVFDRPESADLEPAVWVTAAAETNQATFSVIEGGHRSGRYALKVKVNQFSGGNPWEIQVFRRSVSVKPSTLYVLKAWIKGPVGGQLSIGAEASGYQTLAHRGYVLTGDWQPVAFEFQSLQEQDSVRIPIHFGFEVNNGSALYIDDFSISEVYR